MSITRRVEWSQVEVLADGTLQIRLEKQLVERGELVAPPEYHRTAVPPGVSVGEQMALVNDHLAQMGWPAVEPAVIARIERIAQAALAR